MKTNHLLFVGVLAVVGMTLFYAFTGARQDEGYVEDLKRFRAEKDRMFREDDGSPLDRAQRDGFAGLAYFDPNPAYRITADLEWANPAEELDLPTTRDGQTKRFRKAARATFRLGGQEHALWMLQSAERQDNTLYLFFRDATSGGSTYGAGRYVEVEGKRQRTCVIDFNRAYHPYCAYNDYYICPLPPPGNVLSVPIEAGERLPESPAGSGHEKP